MHIGGMFESKYLKFGDLDGKGDVTMVIQDCQMVQIGQNDEAPKPVLYFEGEKPIVLNKTNLRNIGEMYGVETNDWKGKKVVLWADPNVEFQSKRVGGIKVRGQHELPEGWSKSKPARSADVPDSSIPF